MSDGRALGGAVFVAETILWRARLGAEHRPRASARHRWRHEVDPAVLGALPLPAELRVSYFGGFAGFYLAYVDEGGQELTGESQPTVDAAFQAAFRELGVRPEAWEPFRP